jgi:DNA polymerase-1
MQWQELPEIQHDQVKLGAALDIFWPSWNDKLTLPNDVSLETLKQLCDQHNPNKPS